MPEGFAGGGGVRVAGAACLGPAPMGRRVTTGTVGGIACAVSVAMTDSDVLRMSGVPDGVGKNNGVRSTVGVNNGVAVVGAMGVASGGVVGVAIGDCSGD